MWLLWMQGALATPKCHLDECFLRWIFRSSTLLLFNACIFLQHCFGKHDNELLVTCDYCEEKYHTYCVTPPLTAVPRVAWYCEHCPITDQGKGLGGGDKIDEELVKSEKGSSGE